MASKTFSEEEIAQLRQNPHVKQASRTTITYTYNLCCPIRKAYLSVIMDACTKQILSHVVSRSLEVGFVLETVALRYSHSYPASTCFFLQKRVATCLLNTLNILVTCL